MRALLVEQSGQRLVGAVLALLGEPDQHAAPVGGVGQPLDQALLGQPVDAVGHRARGDQRLRQQLPGRELVRRARRRRSAVEHVELPRLQAVLGERQPPGPVQVPGQPAHPAEHLQRLHVEVRALAAPRSDQPVDLVLHGDQCSGSVDMKSLDVKISGWSRDRRGRDRATPLPAAEFRTTTRETTCPQHPPGTRTSTCGTPATAPAPSPTSSPASPTSPAARPASPTSAAAPATSPSLLADRWPTARITGYDNSAEMLDAAAAAYAGPTPGGGLLDFAHADAADLDARRSPTT